MDAIYTYLAALFGQLPDIPVNRIVSRTVYKDERMKAVLLGFAAGQEVADSSQTL